jgi:hypothetical protein
MKSRAMTAENPDTSNISMAASNITFDNGSVNITFDSGPRLP